MYYTGALTLALACHLLKIKAEFKNWLFKKKFEAIYQFLFIVPTPLVGGGEELYTQRFFFCSVNSGRSIYSSQRNLRGINEKLLQGRIQN